MGNNDKTTVGAGAIGFSLGSSNKGTPEQQGVRALYDALYRIANYDADVTRAQAMQKIAKEALSEATVNKVDPFSK